MNEPIAWNSTSRKTADSRQEAEDMLTNKVLMGIFRDSTEAIFDRKLTEGFELVTPVSYSAPVIRNFTDEELKRPAYRMLPPGAAYIDIYSVALIRKLA